MSGFAADVVYVSHLAVLGYILTGWMSPKPWLYGYIGFFPLVATTWSLTGGCPLTTLENYLRGAKPDTRFVMGVVNSLGLKVEEKTLDKLEYIIPALLCTIAVGRAAFSP